jgi:hypothetical protein
MDTAHRPSPEEAAGTLATVRQATRRIRIGYLRSFFGDGWIISLALAAATFGSVAVTAIFGTRTTDGGQAIYGSYWAAVGVLTLAAILLLHLRQPVAGWAAAHVLLTAGVFALGFAAVFFSPLAHNHVYLSPLLFAATYLLVAAVQRRVTIAAAALLFGAALGMAGLTDAIAGGRSLPLALYGAAFLVMAVIGRLVGRIDHG